MSRWLWGLLAGVVLVAIAAVFWVDETSVLPPVSRGTTPVAPAPAPASTAQNAAPSAPSSPSPPAAQEAAAPSAPAPAPDAGQQATSRRPRRPPKSPRLRPSSRRNLRPRLLPLRSPKRPCRRPRPDGRRQKSQAYMRPRASRSWSGPGPIPQRIASGSSSGAAARWAYRQPVDKFAQAAIVESPKKILLPSAICRIDGAWEVEGMLKVSADCEDSISYTSRSVMIALRSPTELIYSASGDSALATTLKKCAP